MSNNQKRNNLSVSFDGFRGIDCRRNHTGETVASDVVNFRIRSDGSLEKRNGYRLLTDMEGVIRAFHSEAANGRAAEHTY